MMKKSLYKELKRIPRVSEDSSIVASAWVATGDPYLPEIPDVESGNEQCRELYFNITAERLLFRKKLLGLSVDENLVADANILTAHPFGEAGPTFGELAAPSVRLAAAFVPLTPDENNVTLRPVMARLYCVSDLSGRCASPFTEGLQDAGIQNYNWFVAGVKDDVLKKGISGRSWLLAANLLMRIVENNDMATAQNLINNFIVTGNVEDGAISHVEIGRKPELANIKEFRNLKWIIPMKNANEMTAVPVRRIEMPATLDEAYKLIETMRNRATRSMFRFIRELNFDGFVDEYKNGADIYAVDQDTGLTPLQMINKDIDWLLGINPGVFDHTTVKRSTELDESGRPLQVEKRPYRGSRNCKESEKRFRQQCNQLRIKQYLKEAGADCAMCFYLMAKKGEESALSSMADSLCVNAINAKDENGFTAADWALMAKDWAATAILAKHGATCDQTGAINPLLRETLGKVSRFSADDFRIIDEAFALGLPLSAKVDVKEYSITQNGIFHGAPLSQRMPIFAAALSEGDYGLVERCLEHGADPNEMQKAEEFDRPVEEIVEPNEYEIGYPVMLVAKSLVLDKESKTRLLNLLYKYGAQKRDEEFADSPEVFELLNNIYSVKDNTEKCDVLIKALNCGLSPFAPAQYKIYEERVSYDSVDEPYTYHPCIKCTVPLIYAAVRIGCYPLLERCIWGVELDAPLEARVDDEDKHEKLSVHLADATNDTEMLEFLKQHGAVTKSSRVNKYLRR